MIWVDFIVPTVHFVSLGTCAAICGWAVAKTTKLREEALMFSLEAKKAAQIAITKAHFVPIYKEKSFNELMMAQAQREDIHPLHAQAQMDQAQVREFKAIQERNLRAMTAEPCFQRRYEKDNV